MDLIRLITATIKKIDKKAAEIIFKKPNMCSKYAKNRTAIMKKTHTMVANGYVEIDGVRYYKDQTTKKL